MREKDQKQQLKVDRTKAQFGRELDRLLDQVESGVVTVTAEIRITGGGIRSSEVMGGFRIAV